MFRSVGKHLSYANVAATLALVFSLTGGAFAATHYLITSTSQLSPKVIRQLRGHRGPKGERGPQGVEGERGPQGGRGRPGPIGAAGSAGGSGEGGGEALKAQRFHQAVRIASNSKGEAIQFTLVRAGEVTISLICEEVPLVDIVAGALVATGPEGTTADFGNIVANERGEAPEVYTELASEKELGVPEAETGKVPAEQLAIIGANPSAPSSNHGFIHGTIMNASQVLDLDAVLTITPSSNLAQPECSVTGNVFQMGTTG